MREADEIAEGVSREPSWAAGTDGASVHADSCVFKVGRRKDAALRRKSQAGFDSTAAGSVECVVWLETNDRRRESKILSGGHAFRFSAARKRSPLEGWAFRYKLLPTNLDGG